MNDQEVPFALSADDQTEGAHTSLEFHDDVEKQVHLLGAPPPPDETGYAKYGTLVKKFLDKAVDKAYDRRWFLMYVNLALSAHSLLRLVGFVPLGSGRKGRVETTLGCRLLAFVRSTGSLPWAAFVLDIMLLSCSLVAVAGSFGVAVLNRMRGERICANFFHRNPHRNQVDSVWHCLHARSYCSGLKPAMAAGLVACAGLMVGTYVDGYSIVLKRRSAPSLDEQESAKDGFERLVEAAP